MQHTYSYLGSPLHLVLEDKIAEGYNRVTDAFIEAQKTFKEEYGVNWTPELPLNLKCTDEEIDAHGKVADLINLLVEINGGSIDITEEQCLSIYLDRV